MLLQLGADVGAADAYGMTALHVAAGHGATEVVRALLDAGALAGVSGELPHNTPLASRSALAPLVEGLNLFRCDVRWRGAIGIDISLRRVLFCSRGR